MPDLKGKTIFITGASRGIGKSIAIRLAREGANVAIAAKTSAPHPKLEGTIHATAEEVERAGGRALPLMLDVRDEQQIAAAVEQTATRFGGIDVLVNNASAIFLAGTLDTPMKRFDLMFGVNVRATYACSQACIPHLKKSSNPHILNLAPPPAMKAKWFKDHVAYTMSKFGMSMCVLGMSAEFADDGIAVNALWPRTTIATAAIEFVAGPAMMEQSRTPEIMSDAAKVILTRPSKTCTGNFFLDEDLLREEGVTNFDKYSVKPGAPLFPDFFVD